MRGINQVIPSRWPSVRLGHLGHTIGGGTPLRSRPDYYRGHIPWATVKDLTQDEFEICDTEEHITEEAVRQSATNMIPTGSVIIATRVGLGKVAVNIRPIAINQDLRAFVPRPTLSAQYLCFALYKQVFDILKFSQGTTVKGIRQDDLLSLPIPLPPISGL